MDREYTAMGISEYGTFKSYLIGFVLSLALTFAAFYLIATRLLEGSAADFAVSTLAVVQSWIQFWLFLRVARESKPRWNLIVLLFMVLVTVIVVFGSLWIMYHLNYNMMPHMESPAL